LVACGFGLGVGGPEFGVWVAERSRNTPGPAPLHRGGLGAGGSKAAVYLLDIALFTPLCPLAKIFGIFVRHTIKEKIWILLLVPRSLL
jgi:hypothetical protein